MVPWREKLTCARASSPAPSTASTLPSPNLLWNTAMPLLMGVPRSGSGAGALAAFQAGDHAGCGTGAPIARCPPQPALPMPPQPEACGGVSHFRQCSGSSSKKRLLRL